MRTPFIELWAILTVLASVDAREVIPLNENWRTKVTMKHHDWNTPINDPTGIMDREFSDGAWEVVDVPHNWEGYTAYIHPHANLHGVAWYRKGFVVDERHAGRRVFLEFDGVGDYAEIWINGDHAGGHKGAFSGFSLDITPFVDFGAENTVAVRADHPKGIKDLPWVCGGCAWAPRAEGPLPFGLFRPVRLVVTGQVRVEPDEVTVWTPEISESRAVVRVKTVVKNYGDQPQTAALKSEVLTADGAVLSTTESSRSIEPGQTVTFDQTLPEITDPRLWNGIQDPYLHRLRSTVTVGAGVEDIEQTDFGMRWFEWPTQAAGTGSSPYFKLNGKRCFFHGANIYEHLLGNNFAYTREQIEADLKMFIAAGFNSIKLATSPNRTYHELCDKWGLVHSADFSWSVYYDNEDFRTNSKILLEEWVKERRNYASLIAWGIQAESQYPEPVERELNEIIHGLDPICPPQRHTYDHHWGRGADIIWGDRWEGMYWASVEDFGKGQYAIKPGEIIGGYGAWNHLGYHSEDPYEKFPENNRTETESFACYMHEYKFGIMLREQETYCGTYQWIFFSHNNPGRTEGYEYCWRVEPDLGFTGRIGPVNYKGLFTVWREPYDLYYMFKGNVRSASEDPFVYIVSHTWPDRWSGPGVKDSVIVYSNCDKVELFNDVKDRSLGTRTRGGPGTHFTWNDIDIQYNVLYAEGYVGNAKVAEDITVLENLPEAPNLDGIDPDPPELVKGQAGKHYLFRANCGGVDYTDSNGNLWKGEQRFTGNAEWGSRSWGLRMREDPEIDNWVKAHRSPRWDPMSMHTTVSPIVGTKNDHLFQTFSFGRELMSYHFRVPDGTYGVELYFTEPWYGIGGKTDCEGWRIFDVSLEDRVVLDDFDIWAEAGPNRAVKKVFNTTVSDGTLDITFPEVRANQATISAIAVAGDRLNPTGLNRRSPVRPDIKLSGRERGVLNIHLRSPETWRITLYRTDGRVVFSRRIRGPERTVCSVNHCPGGIYSLHITANNRSFRQRVVLSR